jgi:hypothetical protein
VLIIMLFTASARSTSSILIAVQILQRTKTKWHPQRASGMRQLAVGMD